MNIGAAARTSGISAKMIRYYESIGLIRPAKRTISGYRVYTEDEVHSLRFIKRARSFGFSVEEMAELIELWHDKSRASAQVKKLALGHIAELEKRIGELQAMVQSLRELARSCRGDDRPNCPILEDLAQDSSDSPARRMTRRDELRLLGKRPR